MKKLLIIGCSLLGVGLILASLTISIFGLDYKKYTKDIDLEDATYVAKSDINKLELIEHEGSIEVKKGDVENITIDYKINKKEKKERYTIIEKDGKLKMYAMESNGWFHFNLLNVFADYKIVVTVPESYNGSLITDTNVGSIKIKDLKLTKLDVNNNTGSVKIINTVVDKGVVVDNNTGSNTITSLTCDSLKVDNNTGSITLEDVIAPKLITADNNTGSIKIKNIVSDDIQLDNDTGSIKGTIKGIESDYKIKADSDTGSCNLDNNKFGEKNLEADTDTGSIHIEFVD